MPRLFTLLLVFLTGFVFLADAEAARFGGGKSMGRQSPTQSQPAARPQSSTPAPTVAPSSGIGRWMGPLAGLAAGGLLASLFFGDAFDGIQILDILLLAGLIFGGLALFRAWRRQAAPRAVGAGPGGMVPPFSPPVGGGWRESGPSGTADTAITPPAWFDARNFAAGAKDHFRRLQTAWDQGDLAEIRTYTSPDLCAELVRERERLGQVNHHTEVLKLDAELLEPRREGDRLIVSLSFTGVLREEVGGPAREMTEVWHVSHAWDSPKGDWQIEGIQQQG